MLKHLILVMALVVPLVALSFPVGGVGLLDSLGSLLFNRLASEKSTTKSNTSAQQVLSSLATLPVTPGPALASLHLKHNRPRHPKLLARRSAREVDYGNDGADVDGQEDLRFGELPENSDYLPAHFPQDSENSDVYPPLTDSGGRSPFDLYRDLFDDDRQQVEPLSSESDPETEEAPEDPDNDDQGRQEPADSGGRSPFDLYRALFDDDLQQAKKLKLVKALRKGRHAKKQRGNANH